MLKSVTNVTNVTNITSVISVTNMTKVTNVTNVTNMTIVTIVTCVTSLTSLTNGTNVTNVTNFTNFTAEEKLSRRMLQWIALSKKQGLDDVETESSGDSDSMVDTTELEKDSFHNRVMEDSKSFYEDNPFEHHTTEKFKSVFATRLSLTPRSRPPSSSASTPKRSRSPSPASVGGIKTIRKE